MSKTYTFARSTRNALGFIGNKIADAGRAIASVPGEFAAGWRDERPVAGAKRRKPRRSK
jgi:hypothetical protein